MAIAVTGPLVTRVPPGAVPFGITISVPGLNSLRSPPSHIAPLPSMMYWISSVFGWLCLATLPDWMPMVALSVTTRPLAFISGFVVVGGSPCPIPLRSMLARATERGELPPGCDLSLVHDLLVSPLVYRWMVSDGDVGPEVVQSIMDVVLTGVGARQPTTTG